MISASCLLVDRLCDGSNLSGFRSVVKFSGGCAVAAAKSGLFPAGGVPGALFVLSMCSNRASAVRCWNQKALGHEH